MRTQYSAARLRFNRDEIEPLDWNDSIRIHVTNEGSTYEMTKKEFYDVFDNVVRSKSYRIHGYYHYHTTPSKAFQFLVN